MSVAVVIPTRDRPARLQRCLQALAGARSGEAFRVYVLDSSNSAETRAETRRICAEWPVVECVPHEGGNVAAARNACARAAREDLIVNVDDDLVLEPEAIDRLLARYRAASGVRVVAGSMDWGQGWTAPMRMRPVGYARPVRNGEAPDFVMGGFFAYPRVLALTWPWNERLETSDDIFMGALWRSKGVEMLYEAEARAHHEGIPVSLDPAHFKAAVALQRAHVYALLFDAVLANPNLFRAVSYEFLGFLASAKVYLRRDTWRQFLGHWAQGHRDLMRDRRFLRRLLERQLPGPVP